MEEHELFLTNDIILSSKNVVIQIENPVQEKVVLQKSLMNYLNIYRDPRDNKIYLHYRSGKHGREHIGRFISNDGITFTADPNIIAKNTSACHNLICFVDENPSTETENKIKALGGQHQTVAWGIYKQGMNPTIDGLKYDKNIMINIKKRNATTVYSPFSKCNNYANGLHCFNLINDKLYSINQDLPIIHGFHEGRYDAFYGSVAATQNTTIDDLNKFRNNGITVFDGAHIIIYFNNQYILYARSNLSASNRYIQYATSRDLINWSPFNLIKITGRESTIFRDNFYYCNFFTIEGICMAVLPFTNKRRFIPGQIAFGGPANVYDQGMFVLMCSRDGYTWNFLGKFFNYVYEKTTLTIGKPIYSNDGNKHYFYMYNKQSLTLYSIMKNRFSAIQSSDEGIECSCILKQLHYKQTEPSLKLNCKIESNGYIKAELLNQQLIPIPEYNLIDCIPITGPLDTLEACISWKLHKTIKPNNYHIKLVFKHAKIYTINGKLKQP